MSVMACRSRSAIAILIALVIAVLFILAGCTSSPGKPTVTADPLFTFKQMAREASCAELRNRLFLIDDRWVFWDTAGECPDAAYAQTLYDRSLDQVLCTLHDSIGGPVKKCPDASYLGLFETITANLDQPDLGLGSGHRIQPVDF
ncbi:MAG: hypothetical protein ACYCZF_06065 [Anaerolineae bacterium]